MVASYLAYVPTPMKASPTSAAAVLWHPRLIISGLLIAAIALAVAAFSRGLDGPFLLDDFPNIRPAAVEHLHWKDIRATILDGRFGGASRSVTKRSFVLTQYFSGFDPKAFKYQNLLLHLANGLLIFWLTALLFRATRQDRPDFGYWMALLVAAFWMLHPLHVSTVLYAVQRLVILSAFFSLLAAVCYLEGRLLMASRPRVGLALVLTGLIVFWPLALLSKENAALLAPALLLVEGLVLRQQPGLGTPRQILPWLIGIFLIVPVILGILIVLLNYNSLLQGYSGRDFTLGERLLTQVHVLWFYFKQILVPIPSDMGLFHDGFPVQRVLDPRTLVSALGLLSMVGFAIVIRRRAPLAALGILWFFVWHAMESTFLPLELVFEHRNYLALFGVSLACSAGIVALSQSIRLRTPLAAGATAMLLLLGLNTASRAWTWSDYPLFIEVEYQRSPVSLRAVEGMLIRSKNQGDLDGALEYAKRLQALAPDQTWPLVTEIQLRCADSSIPTALFSRAFEQAQNGRVRPADVTVISRLYSTVHSGHCSAVPAAFPLRLAAELAKNDKVHHTRTQVAALTLHARLAASRGDLETSKTELSRALDLAEHDSSPGLLQELVEEIGSVASNHREFGAALLFVEDVTGGHLNDLKNAGVKLPLANFQAGDAEP